jgi:hypothetical protein
MSRYGVEPFILFVPSNLWKEGQDGGSEIAACPPC